MSSTTKDQVRFANIEPLLKDADIDSFLILDWHVCLLWTTETTLTRVSSCHAGLAVLPAVETPTEIAKETETMIRFGKVFSRPLRRLTALSKFERLGACGSGEFTAPPGKRLFTTALIRALVNLLEKTPEGRFTTSKLLSEITDSEDFDTEKHPSLVNWITLSGIGRIGRIVLHPLPKDQIARIPSELGAKLDIQIPFRSMPSVDDIGTLSKMLNDQLAENELGITGIKFVGLRAAAPSPDSLSTPQEMNGYASNESKANDVIDEDAPVDTQPSTLQLSNEQQSAQIRKIVTNNTSIQDLQDGRVGAGLSSLQLSDGQQLVEDRETVTNGTSVQSMGGTIEIDESAEDDR